MTKRVFKTSLLREPNVLKLLAIILLVAAWQVLGMNMSPIFLSTPVEVGKAMVRMIASGELEVALLESLTNFAIALSSAIGLGILVGIFSARYESFGHFLDPYISIFFAMPVVALIPIFIVWFGLGPITKVLIVFLMTFFPMVINTQTGIREVDRTLQEMARSFGGTESEIMKKVILPGTIPFITAGIRISIGRALVGIVVAEIFTAVTGLGALIQKYAAYYQTNYFFVPVIVLAVSSVALIEIARAVEHKFSTWRTSTEYIG